MCDLCGYEGDECHYDMTGVKTAPASNSRLIDGLCGRTKPEARAEILDRMKYFYLQLDGAYKWPNSAEGDLLKMVHGLLTHNADINGQQPQKGE